MSESKGTWSFSDRVGWSSAWDGTRSTTAQPLGKQDEERKRARQAS